MYGVILGGWASNNKYSFLGGLRSSAQLIAYELPLGLGDPRRRARGRLAAARRRSSAQQAATGVWNAFAQPLGFVVFVIAAFAEAARLPFDLPEARAGTDRRLSHRIRRHEAAAVSDRRVPAHDHGVVPDRDSVPRRLALLGHHRRRADATSRGSQAIAADRRAATPRSSA